MSSTRTPSLPPYPTPNNAISVNKVAAVSTSFWLIKMMSTTMGETGADFLIFKMHWGLPLTSLLMSALLAAILLGQLQSRRFHHWLYWLSVVMVSIVGTLITDNLTDQMQVPLPISTLGFTLLLIPVFLLWYRTEGSLSIATVTTRRREYFYWSAILLTFALGTAVGDWLAEGLDWGYKLSGMIFGGLIVLTAIAAWGFNVNRLTCFWIAYILTRPFGASLGDYLSHSAKQGGLGFGTTHTSLVFLVLIVALVVWLTLREHQPAAKAADSI